MIPIAAKVVFLLMFLLVQEDMLKTGQCSVESPLLDGHLCLTVELLAFRSVSEKYKIGSSPNGQQLIKVERQFQGHSYN